MKVKSKNKTFVFQSRSHSLCLATYEVEYWLFETGRKTLASVWVIGNIDYERVWPLDIMQLAASENTGLYELYTEILAAMDNNAETVMEEEGFAATNSNY